MACAPSFEARVAHLEQRLELLEERRDALLSPCRGRFGLALESSVRLREDLADGRIEDAQVLAEIDRSRGRLSQEMARLSAVEADRDLVPTPALVAYATHDGPTPCGNDYLTVLRRWRDAASQSCATPYAVVPFVEQTAAVPVACAIEHGSDVAASRDLLPPRVPGPAHAARFFLERARQRFNVVRGQPPANATDRALDAIESDLREARQCLNGELDEVTLAARKCAPGLWLLDTLRLRVAITVVVAATLAARHGCAGVEAVPPPWPGVAVGCVSHADGWCVAVYEPDDESLREEVASEEWSLVCSRGASGVVARTTTRRLGR